MSKILVIDDESWLREMIRLALEQQGFEVIEAFDSADGINKARQLLPDLILCDVNMDKQGSGYTTLEKLRENAATAAMPFILMTGMADSAGMRHGMELGADDYLPKPFAFAELVARVNALARRTPVGPPLLVRGDLKLDRAARRATRAGLELSLTRKEIGVLEVLLVADGTVVSAEELLERVWDENADPFTRTVVVTLTRLRRKLGEPDLIETVVGAGYRMR